MVKFEGKTKIKYEKVGLPTEMVDEIKRIVETDKQFGFVSIQEFVKDAVRDNIVKYGEIYNGLEKKSAGKHI